MTATAGLEAEAAALQDEYLATLRRGVAAHPRSQQQLIGPSEVGNPCARALLHRLNGDRPPAGEPAWAPAIGTAVHAQVQQWFDAEAATDLFFGRWLTEQRVTVGTIAGQPISGSCDLWDEWTQAVIDHKFVGKSSLNDYRANGPDSPYASPTWAQYRAQAHLYGRGWENAGKTPRLVMIAFVPRDGGDLGSAYLWWERYNPGIAQAALDRANAMHNLLTVFGITDAVNGFSPCTSRFCDWCGGPAPTLKPFTPTGA
jgi:hypothetical protein